MRYVNRAALLFLFILGACLSVGCSEKSTEPKDSPPPSTVMKHLWSERFGDASGQYAQGVAADASGNMIVTGIFNGAVDFGGGPLTSAGSDDIFVAKFGSNGAHVWSKRFGDSDPQNAYDVAVDVSGNVIVAGFFLGPVDFGGGPLTSAGGYDIFVAKFGPGGNHIWSRRFGNASDQFARSVAVDASGNVIVTGYFYGTVDFGCGVLTCAGLSDVFVAEFGPGGDCIWSKRFGDVGDQAGYAVAADASGNAIVAGYFNGTIDFGGGALTSAGDKDIFVAKFEPDGDHIRSERFGDASSQIALAVAVDVSGNVIVAGFFQGSVDFGGGALTSAGGEDIFVAKFGSDGAHVWSKRFGDASGQNPQGVTVDASGNVTITGYFMGTVNFGGGAITAGSSGDMFLAKFGPGGAHIWSKRFGDGSGAVGRAVAVDASGNAIVTGYFPGVVNFGGGALASAGGYDIFVAKFGP